MARQITLHYENGETETVELKPKHLIAAERVLNKSVEQHSVEATFMAAWKASRSTVKFDDWLDGVDRLEEVPQDDVDPTQPDTSLDESLS